MAENYFQTDTIGAILFTALFLVLFSICLYFDSKDAEQTHGSVMCRTCKMNGGYYIPKKCRNKYCKAHMERIVK